MDALAFGPLSSRYLPEWKPVSIIIPKKGCSGLWLCELTVAIRGNAFIFWKSNLLRDNDGI